VPVALQGVPLTARWTDTRSGIVIIREPWPGARTGTRTTTFRFNCEDIQTLKNLASNIEVKPGGTVTVPWLLQCPAYS
jgi:hypothetical protein